MKNRIITLIVLLIVLTSCQDIRIWVSGFEQTFKGLEMVMQSYDENSEIIDRIEGRSISIRRDTRFDSENSSSQVLQITIGGSEVTHVGSSLLLYQQGLINIFDDYAKTIDLENRDRSIPFINRMVFDFKNSFTGKEKVILIRSQNGTPLATFAGDRVSLYSTDVPQSTGLLIDGKYLFIYRCDYTIYDLALLK